MMAGSSSKNPDSRSGRYRRTRIPPAPTSPPRHSPPSTSGARPRQNVVRGTASARSVSCHGSAATSARGRRCRTESRRAARCPRPTARSGRRCRACAKSTPRRPTVASHRRAKADGTAQRRRNPDRAAGVRPERGGHHARADQRARTAAAAARNPVEVVRIAYGARHTVVARHAERQLVQVGLARDQRLRAAARRPAHVAAARGCAAPACRCRSAGTRCRCCP